MCSRNDDSSVSALRSRGISVNSECVYLPKQIENKGMAIKGDIAVVLWDVRNKMKCEQ